MPKEFFVGVNLPWFTYGCDFGANAWQPEGGVGLPDGVRRMEEVFARLAASGLSVVRWFVLCDGRCGIDFDERGVPRGLDRSFARDFDAALGCASRNGIALIPVLFDFTWCRRARRVNGVTIGGRRALLADKIKRTVLLDRVVQPILERYGQEPVIRRWDLFNEPEWATFGLGAVNPLTSLRPASMRSLLADLAELAAATARQGVTVGLASPRGLRLLRGIVLEEPQVHWYRARARRLYPPAAPAGVLLGEFPTSGVETSPEAVLAEARAHGYSGALGWSAIGRDRHSDLDRLERAVRRG